MQKPGDKLLKLVTVLITWAVLLGFFFALESYFVAGQREFLIERHFRSLSALAGELNREFERSRISAESSLRLVASASKQTSAVGPLRDCQNPSNAQRCFRDFVDIYLREVLVRDKPSIAVPRCWGPEPSHIPLETLAGERSLVLTLRCFSREDPKKTGSPDPASAVPVYTLDMTPWIQHAFQGLDDPFEDVLLTDGSGRVLFQRSATTPRIASVKKSVTASRSGHPRQAPRDCRNLPDHFGVNSVSELPWRKDPIEIWMDEKEMLLERAGAAKKAAFAFQDDVERLFPQRFRGAGDGFLDAPIHRGKRRVQRGGLRFERLTTETPLEVRSIGIIFFES